MFFVILDNVSWDYISILTILEAWLSRVQIANENDTWHVNAYKKVEEIKFCRALLKRIIADDYSGTKAHYAHWGRPSFKFEPTDATKEFFSMETVYDSASTKELKAQERQEFHRACKLDMYLEKQDYEVLFKTLNKRLTGWWC